MNIDIVLSGRKPNQKGHMLYDSIYMKYSEQANPKRQKADYWLPRTGGRWENRVTCLMGTGFPFGVIKYARTKQQQQLNNIVIIQNATEWYI